MPKKGLEAKKYQNPRRSERIHVSITQYSNSNQKFWEMEKQIINWVGNKENTNNFLKAYFESNQWILSNTTIYAEIEQFFCKLLKDLPSIFSFRKLLFQSAMEDVLTKYLMQVSFCDTISYNLKVLSFYRNIFSKEITLNKIFCILLFIHQN
jgi:hypothetical protein